MRELPPHEVVAAAYSLGEIESEIIELLWAAARVALVILEPGTPRGSACIARIRERLLSLGAHMAAPCPSAMACPLASPDWCHFAARVERSSLHRKLKGGDLGYEDEKYSYVAVTREPVALSGARVLRHPRLIELELCSTSGKRLGAGHEARSRTVSGGAKGELGRTIRRGALISPLIGVGPRSSAADILSAAPPGDISPLRPNSWKVSPPGL